jgi:6-phosphogluconolactonase (cycloisomerase 2 family)
MGDGAVFGRAGAAAATLCAALATVLLLASSADAVTYDVEVTDTDLCACLVGAGVSPFQAPGSGLLTAPMATLPSSRRPFAIAQTRDMRFAYVSDDGPVVEQFEIQPNGGLAPLSPATLPTSGAAEGVTVAEPTPLSRYVYIANGSDILEYKIEPGGTLSPLSPASVPASVAGEDPIKASPNGHFVEAMDHDHLSSYRVEATGQLVLINKISIGGLGPYRLAISRDGRYVYIPSQAGRVGAFSINAAGTVAPITAFQSPEISSGCSCWAYDPLGIATARTASGKQFVYTTDLNQHKVNEFMIMPGGILKELATISTGVAFGLEATPDGRYLYLGDFGTNSADQYEIQANGRLKALSPGSIAAGAEPRNVAAGEVPETTILTSNAQNSLCVNPRWRNRFEPIGKKGKLNYSPITASSGTGQAFPETVEDCGELAGEGSPTHPVVVSPPAWSGTLFGASWVGIAASGSDGANPAPRYYMYDTEFKLCANQVAAGPGLEGHMFADDEAGAFLNGEAIGHQSINVGGVNDNGPPVSGWPFAAGPTSHFKTGTNTLQFVVLDEAGPSTGLDFLASVKALPCESTGVVKVEPYTGPEIGTTKVVVRGFGFEGVKAVKFGAAEASSFEVISPTKIEAVSPPGSGTVDVTVETEADESEAVPADQFTYGAPPPAFWECLKTEGGELAKGCASEQAGGGYELLEGIGKRTTFKGKGKRVVLYTPSRGEQVTCKGSRDEGSLTSPAAEGTVVLSFTGCVSAGQACTTAGQSAGTIRSNPLEGAIGLISGAEESVGVDLSPEAGDELLDFTCMGAEPTTVSGSVVGRLMPVGVSSKQTSLTFEVNAEHAQVPRELEGDPEDVLVSSIGKSEAGETSLEASLSNKGETLELKA